jgi:hypothetical protein
VINTEAAGVLSAASKHISRWAKQGDKPEDKETFASKRAHSNAWRAVVHLLPAMEHAKESDLYYELLGIAVRLKKSDKEQHRLFSIAKSEDRQFMLAKHALEKMLAECVAAEKADPRALGDKAEAEERDKWTVAAVVRDAEQKLATKDHKKAKTPREKKAAEERYRAATEAYNAAQATAEQEKNAVLIKLGLLKAPAKKAAAKKKAA